MKLLIFLLVLSSIAVARPEIEPFSSDGCSRWPDGNLVDQELWKNCCFVHDISYWMGGTRDERIAADEKLRDCVGDKADFLMGWVMYSGVRIGGSARYSTPFKWGYGWNYNRPYKTLTPAEKRMVAEELDKSCFVGEQEQIIYDYMQIKKMPMNFQKLRVFR